MSTELGPNPSRAWRSILKGRKVLEEAIKWKVGSGQNIKIYKDPWLLGSYPFMMLRLIRQDNSLFTVHQLMPSQGV